MYKLLSHFFFNILIIYIYLFIGYTLIHTFIICNIYIITNVLIISIPTYNYSYNCLLCRINHF